MWFRFWQPRAILTLSAFALLGILIPVRVDASASYVYDQLGRLTNALYDNGTCVSYQYDPSGNRTSQNITASGSANSPNWGSGVWGCFRWTHQ
jgi:YD repeat-containing protein